MSSLIVADKLTKWFGPRLAVDGVSLEVGGGEVMGLLGPNGSGKTTILRMLTGYLRPSAGTASVSGLDVVDEPLEARRRIGYVPEDVPLYDWMRVHEFLVFMARIKGVSGRAVENAVGSVIERFGLDSVVRLPIAKLSRGFRQRVAVAQALLNDPDVLILDEPTNGLDPRQIIEMRELIRSLAGTRTLLITSHILGEIQKVADRVAILLGGRLLATHSLRGTDASARIRVRVRGVEGRVRECLEGVGGVQGVTVEGSDPATYVVDVATPSAREALAGAVVGNGFALLELVEASADLETVFLELTGRGPAASR